MQDATVASQMLGHTNLKTTAIYTRQIQSRMLDGVKDLGGQSGGQIELNGGKKDAEEAQPLEETPS
jgi:hypothetical protein